VSAHDDDAMRRMVHDLRTPLAIVAGFAELLERRAGQLTAEQQAEYLQRIRESAARMGEMLDETGR